MSTFANGEDSTRPHSPPIWLSSVYQCATPDQANELLAGTTAGYVYSRDGHPNSTRLANLCNKLHAAPRGVVTNSGMSALALALISQCRAGEHVLLSDQLYGCTAKLYINEASRWGLLCTVVNSLDPAAVAAAWTPSTRLLLVETITNPLLRVNDLPVLAELCHQRGGLLLVDNTLAGPLNCRPLDWGADLVVESLTKLMNGHSDVLLGYLGGTAAVWDRVPSALSTWGWTAPPFECWLAERGLATLRLRWQAATRNAHAVAAALENDNRIARVHFPGLGNHADAAIVQKLFTRAGMAHPHDPTTSLIPTGTLVAFDLRGGWDLASRFITAVAGGIPFCPSLGELQTTLSHPASTSHRGLSPAERARLGITDGTIRLSVGTEEPEWILEQLRGALGQLGG
ncbi:MAG: PLP-dependent transferase [Pirellulales bacterium]|nr:PLP-dependent transferase [Pirellulales bacterium]